MQCALLDRGDDRIKPHHSTGRLWSSLQATITPRCFLRHENFLIWAGAGVERSSRFPAPKRI
jgi:hypothetical protein